LSDCSVAIIGSKEVNEIARAFETMALSLHQLVVDVRDSTQIVVAGATQVEAGSQAQLASASQQESYNQQVLEAMRELLSTTQQIATIAQQVDTAAARTFSLSDSLFNLDQQALAEVGIARQHVETGLTKITDLSDVVEAISEHTNTLVETSQEIGLVLTLMRDISREIHLLSLNAAIEAAGAGVHGERFTILAGEIRKLGLRSQGAVGHVQQMIINMQHVTAEVVTSVEAGTQQARLVRQDVSNIETSMLRIYTVIESLNQESSQLVKAANLSSEAAEQISSITHQQTRTSDQIFGLVQDTQSIITQLVANQQQALLVSSELSQRSADLLSNVSQFKL
jgi:methyl-accepting chemotaxis protein